MLTRDQAAEYTSRFHGVSPGILADGAWLLTRRPFWISLVDPELADDHEPTDVDHEIRASGTWPVLRLTPTLAVINWWGPDGEGGYDYVVLPEGTDRCITIAGVDGHGFGPGLSWPEAERLIAGGTLGTAEQRLLLLVPALGDAGTPPEVAATVAAALVSVAGVDPGDAAEAAGQLLDAPTRWARQGGALTCDAEYSVRRPGGLSPDDQLLVTGALGHWA